MKNNLDSDNVSNEVTLEPIHFNCPKHGDVTATMTIFIDKDETVYCLRCYNDFLRNNIPVLE